MSCSRSSRRECTSSPVSSLWWTSHITLESMSCAAKFAAIQASSRRSSPPLRTTTAATTTTMVAMPTVAKIITTSITATAILRRPWEGCSATGGTQAIPSTAHQKMALAYATTTSSSSRSSRIHRLSRLRRVPGHLYLNLHLQTTITGRRLPLPTSSFRDRQRCHPSNVERVTMGLM